MRKLLLAIAAAALVLATPASAEPAPGAPASSAPPTWNNVARVNLGVGFYNSGWYNCYTVWGYACTSGTYSSYIPFLVGPQVDINVGGMNNISVGFTVAIGTVNSTWWNGSQTLTHSDNVTMWEPTVDYVAKFGPSTQDTVGRFRIGAGMYIGPDAHVGGAFRIGGGASFLNANRIGAGIDLVLEGGGFNGYWIGGLQLLVAPEFHF